MSDAGMNVSVRRTRKWKELTLAQYVERRNGVPLGAPGSLQNMLKRSLGAGSFTKFWRYWNPIWGYALGRYIYAPLLRFVPAALALILTFTISGAIHDLAATLVRRSPAFLFTPWFLLMSIAVIVEQALSVDFSERAFKTRVAINLAYVLGSLGLTLLVTRVVLS